MCGGGILPGRVRAAITSKDALSMMTMGHFHAIHGVGSVEDINLFWRHILSMEVSSSNPKRVSDMKDYGERQSRMCSKATTVPGMSLKLTCDDTHCSHAMVQTWSSLYHAH